jgi:N-acetylmuramate 1-kinase
MYRPLVCGPIRNRRNPVNPLPDNLLDLARGHLPGLPRTGITVTPMEKGGSDRRFYRVAASVGVPSLIVISYSGHREENKHYVDIGKFLEAAGVNVPHVYLHEPEQGLVFMQDLGEVDLWHSGQAAWETRRPLYEAAIDQALLLHGEASRRPDRHALHLEREFNEQLYLWEQDYFFTNCLEAFFGMDATRLGRLASLGALRASAQHLAGLPRTLVHRDLQSQNVLVCDGKVWLIDFQGMRPGLPHYDLASLLYDPYVPFTTSERQALVAAYLERAPAHDIPTGGDFERILDLCAMQRLMQALGAYGFLGLRRQRPRFLDHIPPARKSLREVVTRIDGLAPLAEALDSLP